MSTGRGSLLGVSVLELRTDNRQLDSGMAQARATAERQGAQMQTSMDKRLSSVGKSMQKTGSSLTRSLTIPILGLGIAAAKMGADFDAAMERVHTQSGASQREVDTLKQKVLDLAKVSAQGPTDLADALYRLEGAGYRGEKAMAALKAASDLAAVGNANVEDTTKTLTQVMKPGIKGVKDFQDAVAQVNATVGAGDMKLPQLVDALGTGVVTSAKQAGLSFKDVTGALAVFGDETNNVSGWAAQLATALHFLTNPTMKAGGALNSIGLQSNQLALDMQKPNGLVTALRDLRTHLDDTFPKSSGRPLTIEQERDALDKYKTTLEQSGVSGGKLTKQLDAYKVKLTQYGTAAVAQAQVLGDLFPGGRGRVLSVLLNQVDLLASKEKQIAGTTNQFGADVAKTQETTAFKIHNDWAKIQTDAVQLGETLGPTFLGIFGAVADEADKIASAFERLPSGAQKAIITGGLITAGLGPAMSLLGLFTSGVGKLWQISQIAARVGAGRAFLPGVTSAATVSQAAGVGQISGVRGTELPGSAMNPITVAIEAGSMANLGSKAANLGFQTSSTSTSTTKTRVGAAGPQLTAAPAAEEAVPAATTRSIATGIRTAASRGLQGLMIGAIGTGISTAVGDEIHGAAGRAVKTIGTDASIGAGFGSIFGPEGIAGGAMVGGLVGTLKHFIGQDAENQGQEWASKFLAPLPKAVRDKFQKPLAQAEAAPIVTRRTQRVRQNITASPGLARGGPGGAGLPTPDAQDLQRQYFQLGWTAGNATVAGLRSVKVPSTQILFGDFLMRLQSLAPQARPEAAKVMLQFAHGLEANKRLPKGAVDSMIGMMENAFPQLRGFLKNQGLQSDHDFAEALKFTHATATLKSTLAGYRSQFGDLAISMRLTNGNINRNTETAMVDLRTIIVTSVGKTRADAIAELKKLQHATNSTFTAMGAKVASAASDMHQSVKDGSALAYRDGAANWAKFADSVGNAMASGIVSADQGAKMIADALNATLKAFGEKPLGLTTIKNASPAQLRAVASGQVSSGALASPHAGGGLVRIGRRGYPGRDTVPLSVGGTDIVVGEGETLAVINRHQMPALDTRLAAEGGLDGFLRRRPRPNYMAAGGIVGASEFGGPGDPTTHGNSGAYGADVPGSIARLESGGPWFSQLAPHSRWTLTAPTGKSVVATVTDLGAGGGSVGGHPRAIDLWWQTANALGLPGTAGDWSGLLNLTPDGVAGSVPSALGAAFASIMAPKVSGGTTVSRIVQAGLDMLAKGANTYASSHTPTGGGGGGGGGASAPSIAGLPAGVGSFDGRPVDKWIIPILAWASQHGWGGHITSGYRTYQQQANLSSSIKAAPGHSNHELPNYPGGAIDVGSPSDRADGEALWDVIRNYPGKPNLVWGGPAIGDWGHFSATGRSRGGLVNATSGYVARTARRAKPKRAHPKPHGAKPLGASLSIPGGGDQDIAVINKELGNLNSVMGDTGDVARLGELLSYWPSLWSISNPLLGQDAGSYIVTTDAAGNSITPYIDTAGVKLSEGELGQELGWEDATVGDLRVAMIMARRLIPLVQAAIKKRQAAIAALKKQIRDNLAKIAGLRQQITDLGSDPAVLNLRKEINTAGNTPQSLTSLRSQLATAEKIEVPSGKKGDARRAARDQLIGSLQGKIYATERGQKVTVTDLRNQLLDVENDDKKKKIAYTGQITDLETLNQQLGGSKTSVGTGGKIAPLNTQLSNLSSTLSTVQGDPATIAGASGLGGELGPALIQESTLRSQIAQLGPGPLGQALTAATGTGTAATTTDDSQLVGLQQQQIATQATELSVLTAQTSALSEAIRLLPPFGGSFASGGVVPGPAGAARTAIVHGGEPIFPAGTDFGGSDTHVHIDKRSDLASLIDVRIEKRDRATARATRRPRPGRPGVVAVR